ncbi:ABC transporter permease [Nocardioides marmotae]|uniref:ABC transporter permease n=1 Tax=Nocardioides marmotae TaxID=2663857 RepID=A0A6I3J696_9ACTN|nr:ABC transporter permease [Nocardioides marmotae]MCR6031323.1 ABC transporter permease [Gordonia jinghuaiqii]MBC9733657.1 ABC transporter permease [Nocardioides marmotae]MTB84760.1 ABC transporter permease [Nocardioides marmotae]MTB94962.1 ABC transporter permease [Nocardioides marmotae]QKE02528.1 ABC transporter permease [Nocardioides marmotae]
MSETPNGPGLPDVPPPAGDQGQGTTTQGAVPVGAKQAGRKRDLSAWLPTITESIAAVVLALLVGAILIIFSTPRVIESLSYFFSYPWDFFNYAGQAVWDGYRALLTGSVGSGTAWTRTLERAAPLICAGLGVSLAFRAGMFNIGAQGQMLIGALVGGFIGFHFDLPPGIHLLAALAGALVAGGLWGAIAGILKARAGAHEVITTIMLNYVARFTMLYFLGKEALQRPDSDNLLSPPVDDSAAFPTIAGVHLGVVLAVVAALGVWWLLERSTLGFEMRAVGANPEAARTAGMSVARVYVVAMTLAGVLAGLAATMTVLGRQDSLTDQVAGTVGFDAITVALLGRTTPLGTVLAGLLFGALSAGGLSMQGAAGVPPELTQVLQALIVLFVAAPALVRGIFRLRGKGRKADVMATGW